MTMFLRYLVAFLAIINLFGCAGIQHNQESDAPASVLSVETSDEADRGYVIEIGDLIDLKFFYTPQLNESVIVRPDGKISLQLVDEITAAGLIPSELDALLTEKYAEKLKYPEVAVIIRSFAGHRVYVGGEVRAPGMIATAGGTTSLQAILQAGGFLNTAEMSSVVVLRRQDGGKPLFMTVNLLSDLKTNSTHNDIILKPYDIVYVPKSKIAELNQLVDQYIDKLIPISLNLGYSWVYELNPAAN